MLQASFGPENGHHRQWLRRFTTPVAILRRVLEIHLPGVIRVLFFVRREVGSVFAKPRSRCDEGRLVVKKESSIEVLRRLRQSR